MNANQVKVLLLDPSTPAAMQAARQLTRAEWDELYAAQRGNAPSDAPAVNSSFPAQTRTFGDKGE